MTTQNFSEMADAFLTKAHTIVWCNVATVDSQGRPRSRVLHPIWEIVNDRPVGWIATGRQTLKAKHLAQHPYLSLAYIADPLKPLYVECHAAWADEAATKQRIWDWFGATPPPLGYDLAAFFGAVDNPAYGVLQLTPWRVELADLFGEAQVWSASLA